MEDPCHPAWTYWWWHLAIKSIGFGWFSEKASFLQPFANAHWGKSTGSNVLGQLQQVPFLCPYPLCPDWLFPCWISIDDSSLDSAFHHPDELSCDQSLPLLCETRNLPRLPPLVHRSLQCEIAHDDAPGSAQQQSFFGKSQLLPWRTPVYSIHHEW